MTTFPPPQYIQLYPTTRCNQKCYFCFNHGNKTLPDLSFDKALKLMDILLRSGIRDIDIMGGEPLLLPWMPDFVKIATMGCLTVNISTNGSAGSALREFDQIDPRLVHIGISLEGSTQERHNLVTNSPHFNLALKSIKYLVSRNLDPIVKTVVTRSMMEDAQTIVNLPRDIGVRRYYLIHMDVMVKTGSLMREALPYTDFLNFYEGLKERNSDIGIFKVNASCFDKTSIPDVRCAGGVRKLSIPPDGSVFPCNLFHRFGEWELGNIFEDDFSDIWTNPKLAFFRMNRANNCADLDCTNRDLCTGGCPAHGYSHYGNMDAPDIRCIVQTDWAGKSNSHKRSLLDKQDHR